MGDFLTDPEAWVTYLRSWPPSGVYVFLFCSTFIENVFPPWPGDTFVVFGGFLLANRIVELLPLGLAVFAGNLVSAWVMYFLGQRILDAARRLQAKWHRPAFLTSRLSELTSEESLARTEIWFRKWGASFVIVSRFSAGIRFFVSIVAGISRMNLMLFSVCFSLGVALWYSALVAGGYALGDNWRQILGYLRIYNTVVIGLIAAGAVVFLVYRWRRRRRGA